MRARQRKLDATTVREIREERQRAVVEYPMAEYLPKGHPCTIAGLSRRYGLSQSCICYLLNGRTYRDIV